MTSCMSYGVWADRRVTAGLARGDVDFIACALVVSWTLGSWAPNSPLNTKSLTDRSITITKAISALRALDQFLGTK